MSDGGRVDLSSLAAGESSMDDISTAAHPNHRRRSSQTLTKAQSLATTDHRTTANHLTHSMEAEGENNAAAYGDGSSEMWTTFTDSFQQVQSVLDRNRVLIQQVNENHQSKIHENLVKNVSLIQEINGNISKVVTLYSDLSGNFSSMCHQRNPANQSKGDAGKSEE
ncbi:hypothetical protein ACH5RR_016812 [Cinchona calisaya]|uniref:Protein EARLY FLOWERING 4 domain-containing protein n=1 Tax=Cinchona calisaya TaxID=153742 RepID=A0ABD2ZXF3_9GENT